MGEVKEIDTWLVVGNTTIEQAYGSPISVQDQMEDVLFWVDCARKGRIRERIGRKHGRVVRTKVSCTDDLGRIFRAAEYQRPALWGIEWEQIDYVPYPGSAR